MMAIRVMFLLLFTIHLTLSFVAVDASGIHHLIIDSVTNWWTGSKEREPNHQHLKREIHHPKNLSIYIGSWNVNARLGKESKLGDWLCAEAGHPPDIYAIGVQELEELSFDKVIKHNTHPDENLIKKLSSNLCKSKNGYREVASVRMVGIMLTVFVREELARHVILNATSSVATGVDIKLAHMGNKGGVGVGLQIYDTYICFVNAHFTAHDRNVAARNLDQRNIEHKMMFRYKRANHEIRKRIKGHHMVFWMGDLNYRMKKCPPHDKFKEHIKPEYTQIVREQDQLYEEMENHRVFDGYQEGPINFKPTYKYDPGTNNWDSSEKKRNPAWCDRVLWKGTDIHQDAYTSVPTLTESDHKPIRALFKVLVSEDPILQRRNAIHNKRRNSI